MMKCFEWLLFDADGTLFDYDLAEAKALQATFTNFSLAFSPGHASTYRKINQQIWLEFENGRISARELRVRRFELLFHALDLQTEIAAFSARYLQNLSRCADLITGAEETIQALHGKYHLAIITNGLSDVQRPRLAHSTIGDLFEEVAISEEIGAAKPDLKYFETVYQRIGRPEKEKILVIGDSLSSDIAGGSRYGLDTCWFNPEEKPDRPGISPTYQIHRLDELIGLLNTK